MPDEMDALLGGTKPEVVAKADKAAKPAKKKTAKKAVKTEVAAPKTDKTAVPKASNAGAKAPAPKKSAKRSVWGKGKYFFPAYATEFIAMRDAMVKAVKVPRIVALYAAEKGVPTWKASAVANNAATLGLLKIGHVNGDKGRLMVFPKSYRGKLDYSAIG